MILLRFLFYYSSKILRHLDIAGFGLGLHSQSQVNVLRDAWTNALRSRASSFEPIDLHRVAMCHRRLSAEKAGNICQGAMGILGTDASPSPPSVTPPRRLVTEEDR